MAYDWSPYAVGGATRPDSFSGMAPEMSASMWRMFSEAPPEIRESLRVSSGYRSTDRQEQLWKEALVKYGSPEEARKWVAPPGRSQHNHGAAADLKFLSPEAKAWVHANAGKYGLAFPLSNEDWHIELAGARDGHTQPGGQYPGQPAPDQQPAPRNALAAEQTPNAFMLNPEAFMRQRNALAFAPITFEKRNSLYGT